MPGRLHDYWRKAHEDSEWQSEEQIFRPGRGEGVAASSEGRQGNGTGVPHPHLCVGEREGRCEETVTLALAHVISSQLSVTCAFNRISSLVESPNVSREEGCVVCVRSLSDMAVLLRRTIRDHLRRSLLGKILDVFQRIHLRFFRACGLAFGRISFASSRRPCRTGS